MLSIKEYKLLRDMNAWADGRLAAILNGNGAANLTICPICRVDDFTHVQGCELSLQGKGPNARD